MDKNALQQKLGDIKKELKCWESMFFRGNGRKPTKDDIESTGNEIRATYKEYAALKYQLNKLSKVESVANSKERHMSSNSQNEKTLFLKSNNADDNDDGVFGKSLNKAANKKEKIMTPSHLKEQTLARKHKFSFAQKKHLKAPPRNEQKADSSHSPPDSLQSEQKVSSQVQPMLDAVDEKDKVTGDTDNQFEDTLKENDLLGNGVLGNVEIISISAGRVINSRKFAKVCKTTSVSGRNYKLSKEWLEKLKPQEESNEAEEMFQNESINDQIGIDPGPRNSKVDNKDILEGETDGDLEIKTSEIISKTSNIEEMNRKNSYNIFDNDVLADNNVTRRKENDINCNVENDLQRINCQDSEILQNEKFPCTYMKSREPAVAENMTSHDMDVKTKNLSSNNLSPSNSVESSGRFARTNAAANSSNCKSPDSANVKTRSSQENETQHTKTPVRASKLYDNRGNVIETRVNDSMREEHSGFNRLKSFDKESAAKKEDKTKSSQQKRKNLDDIEQEKNEEDNALNKAKRAKEEASSADVKGVSKIPRGKRLVSENFVKIDIQKKKFFRGKRRIKASTYKRQEWKKKTQFNAKSTTKCYKCGSDGHWAKECGKRSTKGNPSRFSSFDGKKSEDFLPVHQSEDIPDSSCFSIEDVPELQRPWPRIPYHPPRPAAPVGALFEAVDGQPSNEALKEINKALRSLGYTSFRTGQEKAIARIVSGLSTLLVLSTGSGKSLCYQLPAYLYYKKSKCLTIVISPLVALMEDQVGNLPYGLKGACLHANMTKTQREKVMKDVTDGKIAILLLSPEALVSGSTSTGYLPMVGSLPPIAFACIDEAHCVSEWSHNFRPNYLRVCKVLRDILGVHCFLGLTATSTKATSISITKHLGIDETESENAIIRGPTMPDNLHITVSKDDDRDQALVSLISGLRFHKCTSIIIYCTRREETERLSSILRTCLHHLPPTELDFDDGEEEETPKPKAKRKGKGSKKPKLRTVSWDADSYHAGMTPAHRRRVQKKFMSGELRIVVATTAFGMGLDKADVRAIIHYNMPKSFESYLQEIGRAGRDGMPAHCHVFIDEEAKDLCELRRHTYSNSVDMKSIKRLVNRVFKSCDCKKRTLVVDRSKPMQCNNNVHSDNATKSSSGSCVVDSCKSVQRENEKIFMDDELMEEYFAEDFDMESVDEIRPNSSKERQVGEADVTTEGDAVSTDIVADCPKIKFDLSSVGRVNQPDVEDRTPTINSESSSTSRTSESSAYREGVHLESGIPSRCCVGHHVTFSIEQTVQDLDMPEENISTLLSYLELHPDSAVTLHNPIKSRCTVQCYGGARQMKLLAMKFLPLTAVFNHMRRNKMKPVDAKAVTFNAVEIADEMGWDLDPIYRELRSVQWNTQFAVNQGDSLVGKSGVMVEFDDQSFHVISKGDLSHDERDHICGILHKMVQEQEKTRLLQLDALYNILSKNSHGTYHDVVSNTDPSADKHLRESIQEYFECRPSEMRALLEKLFPEKIEIPVPECKWNAISRDTRTMLGLHHDVMFSGRALARIFHGIDSPCYPAVVWGRDRRFWRRYLDVDFNDLRLFITEEIIKYRT